MMESFEEVCDASALQVDVDEHEHGDYVKLLRITINNKIKYVFTLEQGELKLKQNFISQKYNLMVPDSKFRIFKPA